ncbi:MAG: pyrroline-5-carboxylate reductase [Pseudomonadota bacterium]|jgi:pyrroline-5-carboxylate reductase|nr:pyrroline-5-carboxylate reductase [Alphaproteobacteria bacterium]
MRILMIGHGAMGSALAKGWASAYELTVVDPFKEGCAKFEYLPPDYYPDVVVIAVKPQALEEIMPPYAKFKHCLFISIAAGVLTKRFKKWLGDDIRLARVMPNLPVVVKEGACAYLLNENCTKADEEVVEALLKKVGIFEKLKNEKLFDVVTALSGSGPAYVYYLCECLEIAGKELGLTEDFARKFARQTIIGTAVTLKELPEEDAPTLRANVTSKGGTTEAALEVLMNKSSLQTLFSKALRAACERSEELAK